MKSASRSSASAPSTTDVAPRSGEVQVFAIFDVDHDADLYELLVLESAAPGSRFTVSESSRPYADTDGWKEATRRRIRGADQVIVMCGEFTDGSLAVSSELQIAQEEDKPYFLLWGRREQMCTKPAGVQSAEGMYSWTPPILRDQISRMARAAAKDAEASKVASRRSGG